MKKENVKDTCFDTDWKIEIYKKLHEPEEHWQLKKNFMITNKDKYPEERLVVLAELFCNVEIIGCRYSKKVMKLIAALSVNIEGLDEFRVRKNSISHKIFVAASTAYSTKVKGLEYVLEESDNKHEEDNMKENECLYSNTSHYSTSINAEICKSTTELNRFTIEKSEVDNSVQKAPLTAVKYFPPKPVLLSTSKNNNENIYRGIKWQDVFAVDGPVGNNFVLYGKRNLPPDKILTDTAKIFKRHYFVTVKNKGSMSVAHTFFGGAKLSSFKSASQKIATRISCSTALDTLMSLYWMVEPVKDSSGQHEILYPDGKVLCSESGSTDLNEERRKNTKVNTIDQSDVNTPISDSNIGTKMLKMMGWDGKGLGKHQQGITEPIMAKGNRIKKTGLGCTLEFDQNKLGPSNRLNLVKEAIKNYKISGSSCDLVISNQFQQHDITKLAQFAKSLDLNVRKRGKKYVITNCVNLQRIVEGILENENSFCEMYKLIKPGELNLSNIESNTHLSSNGRSLNDEECECPAAVSAGTSCPLQSQSNDKKQSSKVSPKLKLNQTSQSTSIDTDGNTIANEVKIKPVDFVMSLLRSKSTIENALKSVFKYDKSIKSKAGISVNDVEKTAGFHGIKLFFWYPNRNRIKLLKAAGVHNNVPLEINYCKKKRMATAYINGIQSGEATGKSRNAKGAVSSMILSELLKHCYVIKVKDVKVTDGRILTTKGMVYKEEAVDKREVIQHPVAAQLSEEPNEKLQSLVDSNLSLLGYEAKCMQIIVREIENYVFSENIYDFEFSSEFKLKHSRLIKSICVHYGLKLQTGRVTGVLASRQNVWEILGCLIHSDQDYTKKYEIYKPGTLKSINK